MPQVWLNGTILDQSAASVSLQDAGLLHAAGVFTTMRALHRRIFRLDQHLERLRRSCEALFIPLQYKDEVLRDAMTQLLAREELADGARLRITITRGRATQDPLHGLRLDPTAFITATALETYQDEFYRQGMTVIVLDEQKLNPFDLQAGHKTLNYLSRLAALKSANQRGGGEALWFDVHNYLQSGSISNVFIVKDDRLITPPTPDEMRAGGLADKMPYPRSSALPGITRAAVIELAIREGIEVERGAIDINRLLESDEIFLTNSIMQVMPVRRIERKTIGEDGPGPLTMRLRELLADLTAREAGA